MRRWTPFVAAALAVCFVAGCSGGSSDSTAGSVPAQTADKEKGPKTNAAPGMMSRPPGNGTPFDAGQKLKDNN